MTITQQLDRIGEDIVQVLAAAKSPLTQEQLHILRNKEICNLSSYGWSFALEKLERKHMVEFVPPYFWKLKDQTRTMYINIVEEMCNAKVIPD